MRGVIEQFEREEAQRDFVGTVLGMIEARTLEVPGDFAEVDASLLGEVVQSGVQTISSVTDMGGSAAKLCERAMVTFLR